MSALTGRRLYSDTNIFIGYAEDFGHFSNTLRLFFASLEQQDITLVTSELALAEVLVLPYRQARDDLVAAFEQLLAPRERMQRAPIDIAVLRSAAKLRSTISLRLPDAIHVATAMASTCSIFVSEDQALRTPLGLELWKVDDIAASMKDTG